MRAVGRLWPSDDDDDDDDGDDEDDCGASDARRGVGDIFVLPWVSPVISGSPTFENCLGE